MLFLFLLILTLPPLLLLCAAQFTASTLSTSLEDEKVVTLVPGSDGTECKGQEMGEASLTQEQVLAHVKQDVMTWFSPGYNNLEEPLPQALFLPALHGKED